MSNKFQRYFKKSLTEGAIDLAPAPAPVPQPEAPIDDTGAFEGSFEDDSMAQDLEGEVENAGIDPRESAEILKKADKYAENIDKLILPLLRKIHNDIVTGQFATVAPDIKGISGTTEDLAKLAESLRGRVRDAIAKSNDSQ